MSKYTSQVFPRQLPPLTLSKQSISSYKTRSNKITYPFSFVLLVSTLFWLTPSSLPYSLTLALILTSLLIIAKPSTSIFSTQNFQVITSLQQAKNLKHQPVHLLTSGLVRRSSTLLLQSITICVTLLLTTVILNPSPVLANPPPPPYKIKFVNLDVTSDTPRSSLVKPIQDFSFTISDISLDFQAPEPNTLTTKTNTLTISAPGLNGYSVLASTNHPLKLEATTTTIADTSCDQNSCHPSQAASWTKTTTHGFGYNLTGQDIASDFIDSTYFRPFNQTPTTILTSTNPTTKSLSLVTYQLNLPTTQAAGSYTNQIIYYALPSY